MTDNEISDQRNKTVFIKNKKDLIKILIGSFTFEVMVIYSGYLTSFFPFTPPPQPASLLSEWMSEFLSHTAREPYRIGTAVWPRVQSVEFFACEVPLVFESNAMFWIPLLSVWSHLNNIGPCVAYIFQIHGSCRWYNLLVPYVLWNSWVLIKNSCWAQRCSSLYFKPRNGGIN